MTDWGGEPLPADVRLSPAQHYDQAVQALTGLPAPTPGTDPQLLGYLEVLSQVGLGLLRATMMENSSD